MTNTTIKTNNETINNTMMMEDGTMMNYKEMKWVEVVAYAKGLGINTGHKKRVEIESDIETYFANQNVVPVGDMSSDKYYPELQEEQPKEMTDVETRILESINAAKYESKYSTGLYLIKTVSLMTCIRKNVEEKYRTDAIIKRIIQKMINKDLLSTCSNGSVYRVK